MTTPLTRFASSLKCNVANVIDSLSVELNGKKIISELEYKNFWNNLRAQTETAQATAVKHAADRQLYPDDWRSINFSSSSSSCGDGYANNQIGAISTIDGTLGQTQEQFNINNGFFQRMTSAPMVLDNTDATPSWGWASFGKTAGTNIAQQNGKGCFKEYPSAAASAIAAEWYYMLRIRLVDLHPIFKELDLLANPQIKFRLRVNTGTVAITGLGNTLSLSSVTMTSGQTVPIMVASAGTINPLAGVFASTPASTLSFSFGALRNAFTAQSGDYFPYCTSRLYMPFYDLVNPSSIISRPVKTVHYLDCYSQYFKKRAGVSVAVPDGQLNAAFSLKLSASLKNVKYIALIPYAETGQGHFATAINVEQFQSPFDSAPWTCMPGANIRNFNVQIGNRNVFASSHEYDYESFNSEFSKLSAINGDLSDEMNCGLIDSDTWAYANRIMIADCSYITEKDVPQSIQISGVNTSAQGINILVLVAYEREMDIDRLTGEVHRDD